MGRSSLRNGRFKFQNFREIAVHLMETIIDYILNLKIELNDIHM